MSKKVNRAKPNTTGPKTNAKAVQAKKTEQPIVSNKKFNVFILPLMFVLGIVPLIVRLKDYKTNLENVDFFATAEFPDLFLYYKQIFFIVACTIMIVLIIAHAFVSGKKLSFSKLFIPLAIYAILSLFSAICSKNASFSFTGIFEQFESVWALLGYALTAYYGFLFISSEKDLDWLMIALTFSTVLILLIGLSQAFSVDFFRSDFARYLLLPSEYANNKDITLNFAFPLGRVYLTMYNPNYVGSYVTLLAPVFLMYAFAKKKIWFLIFNIVVFLGLLLCILGSGSKAGFIGVFFSLILLGVIFNKKLIKFVPELMILIVLVVGSIYTYNNYSNGAFMNRFLNAISLKGTETDYPLKDIETNDDNITIHYNDNKLVLGHYEDMSTNSLEIFIDDGNGEHVDYESSVNEERGGYDFTTTDERFSRISFNFSYYNDNPLYSVNINGKIWYFMYLDNSYYYINNKNRAVKMHSSEYVESMDKYGRAFSGRFFIWSRTLPLLKDNIFLGTGPDTFLLNFPNDDYVAMYNNGYENQHMTKPHNMYLQIAVQTGVLSLIAFLVFYFWYFISSIRLYMKAKKYDYYTKLGIGILCGTFGYMAVGIINDSMIVVAPLYWTLIGIGLAINSIIRRNNSFAVIDTLESES